MAQSDPTDSPVSQAACFRTPRLQMLEDAVADSVFLSRHQQTFSVAPMRSGEAEALGNLVPYLLCGEESAVHVFYREGRRARQRADDRARELMWQIAGEEKVHERLLAQLTTALPAPEQTEAIRLRAHDFFVGLANNDPTVHFSRVAALDSGVCKIMAALCAAPSVINCPSVQRIFGKIRSDESRHVRISRQYVLDLGLQPAALSGAAENISADLVGLLTPGGDAFENMGVDADRLFRRIKREEM
jgi:rubrerythrin